MDTLRESGRVAKQAGFSLHAEVVAESHQRELLERLCFHCAAFLFQPVANALDAWDGNTPTSGMRIPALSAVIVDGTQGSAGYWRFRIRSSYGMAPQNTSQPPPNKSANSRKKSAGRPKTPISKETLIDIAAQHFTERGYNGASLDDIARGAGLTKPALLYHYPSKEQLYLAVMDFYVAILSRLILDALMGEGDFEQRLDTLSELMVDYLGQHPALARLLLRDAIDNGPFVTRHGQTLVQYALELTYRFLRNGIVADTLDDEAIRHLVISILGIHFMHFSLPQIVSSFTGQSPFAADAVEARKRIVKQQVRRLCSCPTSATRPEHT